jgi:hypothetical protein
MRPPKRNKLTEAREILNEAVKIQSPWRKISEDLLGKVDAARARGEVRLTDPSMSVMAISPGSKNPSQNAHPSKASMRISPLWPEKIEGRIKSVRQALNRR